MPVVVDGGMYVSDATRVFALDGQAGRPIWEYHRQPAVHRGPNRGVAVLGNKIYFGTQDAHLGALDARTGSLVWDTGYVRKGGQNWSAADAKLVVAITYPVSKVLFFYLRKASPISKEELAMTLKASKIEGVLTEEETALSLGYLNLQTRLVKEVMRPKEDILYYDLEEPIHFAGAEAGGRLIHDEDARLGPESAGDLRFEGGDLRVVFDIDMVVSVQRETLLPVPTERHRHNALVCEQVH